jgi:hypothetical protein
VPRALRRADAIVFKVGPGRPYGVRVGYAGNDEPRRVVHYRLQLRVAELCVSRGDCDIRTRDARGFRTLRLCARRPPEINGGPTGWIDDRNQDGPARLIDPGIAQSIGVVVLRQTERRRPGFLQSFRPGLTDIRCRRQDHETGGSLWERRWCRIRASDGSACQQYGRDEKTASNTSELSGVHVSQPILLMLSLQVGSSRRGAEEH